MEELSSRLGMNFTRYNVSKVDYPNAIAIIVLFYEK